MTIVNGLLIPDTGQNICYTDQYDETITCPTTVGQQFYGQDGCYQGVSNIFVVDNSDLTVTDNVTGLIWEQNFDNQLTWTQAKEYCESSPSHLPSGNWRLPTIKELMSILNLGTENPAINDPPFNEETYAGYWSSTFFANNGSDVMSVHFALGAIEDFNMSNTFYVRCVKGETAFVADFAETTDTVIDYSTGLEWQKGENSTQMIWKDALYDCETKSLDGRSDWRLPNYKELLSIVNFEAAGTKKYSVFPSVYAQEYWTSTTDVSYQDEEKAWYVDFSLGGSGTNTKANTRRYRCVRGGH